MDVPREQAPGLLSLGPLAHRVAHQINARPELARVVMCAPRRALHVYGALLHRVGEDRDTDSAERILTEAPRAILQDVMRNVPAKLYRTLDRAPDRVQDSVFYRRLHASSLGPFSRVLFDDGATIDHRLLDWIDDLAVMDPAIQRLPHALIADPTVARSIGALLHLLRAYGVGAPIDDLGRSVNVRGVLRRILGVLDHLPSPDVQVTIPEGMRRVNTVGDLRDLGRRWGLCVATPLHRGADHWMRLLNGVSVYLASTEPLLPMLVELRGVAPGVWSVVEATGIGSRPLSPTAEKALHRRLSAAGIALVSRIPSDALVALASHAEDLCGDLDAALAALGDDWG
ncbi:hypothetical protein [Falsiroseomonas sp.]|uniref:hypothetical protein n=1 Tax=Falsiroseomonas sp. TaxID=2870721 RepID=UPI002734C20E|nr:hypothetical protein [Falsiroseomonas sp.]MDP3416117.1 hypothetical protein [Falsiroseomonas sp.]